MTQPKAYSPAQLAEFWGVSRKTILRIIKRGELPAVFIGPQALRITAVDASTYYAKNSRGLSRLSPVVPGNVPPPSCESPAKR